MNRGDAVKMLCQILDTYEPGSMTRKAVQMGIDALMTLDSMKTGEKRKQGDLCFICALSGIVIGIMFMMALDIIGMK